MSANLLTRNSLACLRSSMEAAAAVEVGDEFGELRLVAVILCDRSH